MRLGLGIGLTVSRAPSGLDPDAAAYIAAVQTADGQALESGVRKAINNFVVGCKSDGIWDAIKASCILAGARTLSGALTPLVGTAPTNNNFVAGDYNRETGLIGDASTKYLDSSRANNADPQNSNHNAVYVTQIGGDDRLIGAASGGSYTTGDNVIASSSSTLFFRLRNQNASSPVASFAVGFIGGSRSSSSQIVTRANSTSETLSQISQSPSASSVQVFAAGTSALSDSRISFYSIGESLDLEALDTRVSRFMAEMPFAINTGLDPSSFDIDTLSYINAGYAAGGTLA